MALLRSTREGKIYDSAWGKRMTGTGPYAWMIGRRFEMASDKIGLSKQKAEAAHRSFRAAAGGGRAAEPVLTGRFQPLRVRR